MLMATRDPEKIGAWVAALTAAMLVTTVVLVGAHRLQAILGERAVLAMERLMGLVLTALAVEMLLDGIRAFVSQVAH
jgi:small neutral amino acid transporter SnatA (MarC family)